MDEELSTTYITTKEAKVGHKLEIPRKEELFMLEVFMSCRKMLTESL